MSAMICTCPQCGTKLSASVELPSNVMRGPAPGDLSVCLHCGISLVFNADLSPRVLTAIEFMQLSEADRLNLGITMAFVKIARLDDAAAETLQ